VVIAQSHPRAAAEHAPALARCARFQAEAVFEPEQDLVAAAQILASKQTPARPLHIALGRLVRAIAFLIVGVCEAGIDNAVERHTALGESRLRNASGHGDGHGRAKDLLVHLVSSGRKKGVHR